MGRKSRLKRERKKLRALGLVDESIKNLVLLSEHHSSVYRFFPKKSQADALTSGKVWISTLERCRAYEDPEQGDPEEAHEVYNSGHAVGGSDNPEFVEVARRSGIHIGPGCNNITLSNCTNVTSLPNAYVLCTTTQFSPDNLSETFGKHCVEIADPKKFFIAVSKRLESVVSYREAAAGPVIYRDRSYTGLERPPGPIGFVKPKDKYSKQKEYRFLWIPDTLKGIKPFLLDCPEIKGLCRKIA